MPKKTDQNKLKPPEPRPPDVEYISAYYGKAAAMFVQGAYCKCGKQFTSLSGDLFRCSAGHKKRVPAEEQPPDETEALVTQILQESHPELGELYEEQRHSRAKMRRINEFERERLTRQILESDRSRRVQPMLDGRKAATAQRRSKLRTEVERLAGKSQEAIARILSNKTGTSVNRKTVRGILDEIKNAKHGPDVR